MVSISIVAIKSYCELTNVSHIMHLFVYIYHIAFAHTVVYTELIYTFTTTHPLTYWYDNVIQQHLGVVKLSHPHHHHYRHHLSSLVVIVHCRRVTTFARREFPVAARSAEH